MTTKYMYRANLFYFGTWELKYFAYLSLHPSVSDYVYDVKHHISTKMHFVGYLLEETLVIFWAVTLGEGALEKIMTNGGKGPG